MRKLVAPSLALIASAAVVLITACSSIDNPAAPSSGISAFGGGTANVGTTTAAVVQVCVDPASPAGIYTFTASNPTNLQAGDVVQPPVVINTTGPGAVCGNLLTRTPAGTNGAAGRISITATTPTAGTFTYVCANDPLDKTGVMCGTLSGGNPATLEGESSYHGSTIAFKFVATVVPPPPPPPVGTCTYSQGYFKNHGVGTSLSSPVVTTYVSAGKLNVSGGLDRNLLTLGDNTLTAGQIPAALVPANSPASMRQLITAELNVTRGSTTTPGVVAAINGLRAYFAGDNTIDVGALTQILDDFNNGLIAGASKHCD